MYFIKLLFIALMFIFEKLEGRFECETRRRVSCPVCMQLIVTSCVSKEKLVNVAVPGFCRYSVEKTSLKLAQKNETLCDA